MRRVCGMQAFGQVVEVAHDASRSKDLIMDGKIKRVAPLPAPCA